MRGFLTNYWSRVLLLAVLAGMMAAPGILQGRAAQSTPLLSDASGHVVRVSTEAQLQAAVRRLASNTTIVLEPGTYQLTRTLTINGNVSNIVIHGATNDPNDVVLRGRGMGNASSGNVLNGISVGGGVQAIGIANLTLRDFFSNAVVFNAGTKSPHIYHVRLLDAGDQFIRSHAGVDNGVVEYSTIEYSTMARQAGRSAVEIQGGANWTFRHNLF